jgi:hypothetical protein
MLKIKYAFFGKTIFLQRKNTSSTIYLPNVAKLPYARCSKGINARPFFLLAKQGRVGPTRLVQIWRDQDVLAHLSHVLPKKLPCLQYIVFHLPL